MIIDCDTHFMPRDAFDYLDDGLRALAPRLKFDQRDVLTDIDFPGAPEPIAGTTPLPAPGSGAHYVGNTDMAIRLADYERLGIERQMILPQFTGWWSYLIEPELACRMARVCSICPSAPAVWPVAWPPRAITPPAPTSRSR